MTALDMSTFLHKDCRSDISAYDLTAVICHHGTVGGGHYTSYARHETNGKWYEFDDQLITEVSDETVQNCEAYVLFYRKSNPTMAAIRLRAFQLTDMCAANTTLSSADICFFVSKQWLNRFYTFAEPGPIDNWTMLCPHGAFAPATAAIRSRLVVALAQPLWEYLHRQFGGGPVCNHLFECDQCRRAAEALARRQTVELESFQRYKDETTARIYAISMAWLRQWQQFVGGGGGGIDDDPGPINNGGIAGSSGVGAGDAVLRSVRPGSDYVQINSSLWKFFYGVYGGGPVILLRGEVDTNSDTEGDDDEDVDDNGSNRITNDDEVERPTTKKAEVANVVVGKMKADEPAVAAAMITNGPMTMEPSPPPPSVDQRKGKKVVKNVSFEDESEQLLLDNSSITSSTISSSETMSGGDGGGTVASTSKPTLKRSKHAAATATVMTAAKSPDIVSKKDKRHRGGITTNGLFGPEGELFFPQFNLSIFMLNVYIKFTYYLYMFT